MPLSDDVVEEVEALEAIFGGELTRTDADGVQLVISPEPDCEGHVFGVASLRAAFPEGYPAEAPPLLTVSCGSRLSDEACATVQALADQTAAENLGGISVFVIADAIKDWLQEHTRAVPTPPPTPPPDMKCHDGPDDFDVDSDDLDSEMIDALKEVLAGDSQRLQELRGIKKLEGKEQRTALRAMLRSLTPSQRDALVASSSESEDEAPTAKAKATSKQAVKMPPASIECPAGHELTAYSSRPPDYRKFDDGDYTCDVCGQDAVYKRGVYHCTKCFANGGKQFDACPACGVGGGSGGKKQKNKGKKK